MKPVYLKTKQGKAGTFTDGPNVWKVNSLLHHVADQDLEPFDLPLCAIHIGEKVWETGDMSVKQFVIHWRRASKADLKYPVIMDADGFIMDGWHRVAKALFLGMSTIKAVRFDETPDHDYTND